MNLLAGVSMMDVFAVVGMIGLLYIGARFAWGVLVVAIENIVDDSDVEISKATRDVMDTVGRRLADVEEQIEVLHVRIGAEVEQFTRSYDAYLNQSIKRGVGRPKGSKNKIRRGRLQ